MQQAHGLTIGVGSEADTRRVGAAKGVTLVVLVGAQPDWALGLTLIRQVPIRQVENVGPPDLDLHSYS